MNLVLYATLLLLLVASLVALAVATTYLRVGPMVPGPVRSFVVPVLVGAAS